MRVVSSLARKPSAPTAIFISLTDGKFYNGAGQCAPWEDLVCGHGQNPVIVKTFNVAGDNIASKGCNVYVEAAILKGNRPITININDKWHQPGVLNRVLTGGWDKVVKVPVAQKLVSEYIKPGPNVVVISTNGDLPHLRSVQLEPIR